MEFGAIEASSVHNPPTPIFQVTKHHQNLCCFVPIYTEAVVAETGLHQISVYLV
jgi:hypothetical protein